MKRKMYFAGLTVEAILCLCLYSGVVDFAGTFPAVMAFPFQQLGAGLRMLSLSGSAENAAAIVLYLAAGMIPLAVFGWLKWTGRGCREDGMLVILSVLLLLTLYLMTNPGLIAVWFQNPVLSMDQAGEALLGCTFYSVLVCYLVLRIFHDCGKASTEKLQRGLVWLLYLLAAVFVYCIFGSGFGGFVTGLRELKEGNTAVGGGFWFGYGQAGSPGLMVSAIFLLLRYLATVLPYVTDIFVAFAGIRLLREIQTDRYSEETGRASERLSRLCRISLSATVAAAAAVNLLQLAFIPMLYSIDGSVEIPLLSIIFTLAAFLLSRFIREDQRLKADHDLFI